MSLILDALNKADKERSPEDTPSIQSDHEQTDSRVTSLNPVMIYGLIGLLVVLLCVIIFILLNNSEEKTADDLPATEPNKPTETRNLSVKPTAPSHPSSPQLKAQQSERYTQVKEKLIAQQYASASEPQPPSLPSAHRAKASTPEVIQKKLAADKVASIYQQNQEDTPKKKKQAKPTPVPTPTAAPKLPSLADFPRLNFINDLAYAKQKEIPTLMYTEHVYAKNNASVTLNNIKRKTGQMIADHLTLETIVEDGIVLRYKDLRFKVSAYNSWINM